MKMYFNRIIIIFFLFLLLYGFITVLNSIEEEKSRHYLREIKKMEGSDIVSVSIKIRNSQFCLGNSINISRDDFKLFVSSVKSFSVLENQRDRLMPAEVFEFKILLRDKKDPICFLLFNSKKYNGVVRFLGNCNNMPKTLDVKNSDLLKFIHKKCITQ